MAVFELKMPVSRAFAEPLEELLMELEEQSLMLLEDKISGDTVLRGYFSTREDLRTAWDRLSDAARATRIELGEPTVGELADEDWKDSYKVHFKASKFGRLNWVPVWERETFTVMAGEEVLWLDPGMAFGTGNHETTRLCCARLAEFVPEGEVKAIRVIDAGCGSGILALSAVKLGFSNVFGFDNDEEAIRISEENAALNALAGRVDFRVADLVTGFANRQAELVLANIQADILLRFARQLIGSVAPKGQLVLSGILAQELPQVRDAFSVLVPDWSIDSRTMGEWSDLRLRRSH